MATAGGKFGGWISWKTKVLFNIKELAYGKTRKTSRFLSCMLGGFSFNFKSFCYGNNWISALLLKVERGGSEHFQ